MSKTTRVKFNEAISCMDGSFASGEVQDIPSELAAAWLKSGQVSLADKQPVTPDATEAVKAPFTPKDTPSPKKVSQPQAPTATKKPAAPKAEKKLKFG